MAQMTTKHQEMPEADRVVDAPQAAVSWTNSTGVPEWPL